MALINAMSVTEHNLHAGDEKPSSNGKKGFKSLVKPYYFEHNNLLKQNKMIIRDTSKEGQIFSN